MNNLLEKINAWLEIKRNLDEKTFKHSLAYLWLKKSKIEKSESRIVINLGAAKKITIFPEAKISITGAVEVDKVRDIIVIIKTAQQELEELHG